jgi:hypothetical protein
MTVITLNLLAEEQQAEQANARDPLKTAIAIGVSVVALTALAGMALWFVASNRAVAANLLETQWARVSDQQQSALAESFTVVKAAADEISALNSSRTPCAPQLALVKELVPDNVQLVRLKLQVATEVREAGSAAGAEDDGDAKNAKQKRAAVARTVESMSLQLEGRAYSDRPEIEVDDFINSLRTNAVFSSQVKQIQLRSIARSDAVSSGKTPASSFAAFVVDCQYKERK